MITHYPYQELGHADHGWLNARHHFSFADYRNAKRMSFGTLRVINDDIIQAGSGFATHPHQNMEIITFVRQGAISHRDSFGNEGRTAAGDVQVMSAGTGIFHSEFNREDEETRLFQIWITPNEMNVAPRWDSFEFPKQADSNALSLLVSGDGSAPLHIHQDAYIYGGTLAAGASFTQAIHHQVYLLVSEGSIEVEGQTLHRGDGLEITGQESFKLSALEESQVLVLDVPES
ncbi:MAG: pirin family protein [Pseudomonadota bacterium]